MTGTGTAYQPVGHSPARAVRSVSAAWPGTGTMGAGAC